MPKPLFGSKAPEGQQHVQIVVDMLPDRPLDQEEVVVFVEALRRAGQDSNIPMGIFLSVAAHMTPKCTQEDCSGLGVLITEADNKFHKAEGTTHEDSTD